jgi:hypothetical protein
MPQNDHNRYVCTVVPVLIPGSMVILENLIGAQLVNKIMVFRTTD